MSKARIAAYSEGSASVFCFWLAKFRILATKQKPFLLTRTKALFWGKKLAHCHHVMRKLFLNYPYLSSSI
jgi:hypothetical protein